MGERRLVDQKVFHCPELITLPVTARYLWIGLIVCCDRNGMIRADERFIRSLILPNLCGKAAHTRRYLELYVSYKMLIPCELDGVKYYRVKNFSSYHHYKKRLIGSEMIGDDTPPTPSEQKPEPENDARTEWLEFFAGPLCGAGRYQDAVEAFDRLCPTLGDVASWKLALELCKAAQKAGKYKLDPIFTIRARMLSYTHPKDASLDFWVAYEAEKGERQAEEHRKAQPKRYSAPVEGALKPDELAKLAITKKPIASGMPPTAQESDLVEGGSTSEPRAGLRGREGRL